MFRRQTIRPFAAARGPSTPFLLSSADWTRSAVPLVSTVAHPTSFRTTFPLHHHHYSTKTVDGSSRPIDHSAPPTLRKEEAAQTTISSVDAPGAARNVIFHDFTVADLLKRKRQGKTVVTVHEDDSTFDTIAKMTKLNVGAVLIKNKEGKIVGIFTERDYLTKVALKGLSSKQVAVKDLMTRNFHWIGGDNTVVDCMRIMTTNHFRHLPVHNNSGELLGMVSIGDMLVSVLNEYHDAIEHYQSYIGGDYSSPPPRDETLPSSAAAAAPHVK
eukprot:TRINITY_DN1351_c0_g1_i2.p1 TRINITY_DN1351_c0_g1~~TRINITY_DN1351_c0_g1_i2.p1  ORF type:complete len:271 (+),score=50.74 TRINITY_DN1351_c0_g1_i2:153-965(+)